MTDMTVGSPHRHLWRYALPLLLGNWLQLSYNAIDSMIAGRFIGKEALAAEGIAAPVMNLAILAITGLCIGTGVLMSEAFGAKDREKLRRTLATTLLFGISLCCAATVAGILLAPLLLHMLEVPAEIYPITVLYLRITFLGMPFTFFYNALSSALKSVGDSKTPLKFLAFSAALNGLLDLVFLGLLGFGVACSAATTVFAEAVSALLSGAYFLRKTPELWPEASHWQIDPRLLRQIGRYGAPTALQQAVQPVGKLLIQGAVNTLGVTTIAAFNAVTRVDDFAFTPQQSISAAISTYIAQNRGAGQPERVRPGFRAGLRLEALYWMLVAVIVLLLRTPLVSLFVTGENASEVVSIGSRYLGYMALFYLFPAMTNGFQGFYRGVGKMYTTMLGTFLQTFFRTVFTLLLAPKFGISAIAFSCAVGWSIMLLFEVPYYFFTCKKQSLP